MELWSVHMMKIMLPLILLIFILYCNKGKTENEEE